MLCVASHYHEIPDIISDQKEFIINEKRDWTSCDIPELIIYLEINEVLTQIIAVHSLFKSFQNTAINDTSPLLSSWRYGKFWWIM